MGSNNGFVHVHHIHYEKYQIGSVSINSFKHLKVYDCTYEGNTEPIPITSFVTGFALLQAALARIPGSALYLEDLKIWAAANPQEFAPILQPDGAYYGIKVSSGIAQPVLNPGFPTTPEICAYQATQSQGTGVGKIEIEDLTFKNMKNIAIETVTIDSRVKNINPNPLISVNLIPIFNARLFGVLRWKDAFNSQNEFEPNAFLRAMAFGSNCSNSHSTVTSSLSTQYSVNYECNFSSR